MYRILFTLFVTFGWLCLHAQTIPSRRYTTADGLVSDRITCMVQDEQGFLWTASFFGISRYDGYRFTRIALTDVQQNKYVTALAATNGAVYAGFLFGGGLMEYRQGKVTAFTMPTYKRQSFNDVLTISIHYTNGILVCGSGNSVYHFVNGHFSFLFALDSTYANVDYRYLAMDKPGNIWIATDKGLLVYTTNRKLMLVSDSPTFTIRASGKGVITVSQNKNNAVLSFVELQEGMVKTEKLGEAMTIIPVPQNNFQPDQTWLLDTSGRFIHITPNGKMISFMTKGVASDDVHFLYSDRENNLWIATHTGLVKMPNLPSGFYPYDELANATGSITGNDSGLWISNGRHIYLFNNEEIKRMNEINMSGTLFYNNDQLWIGNDEDGLCQVQLNNNKILSTHRFTTYGSTEIRVHMITKDDYGGIWACGRNGIFYFKDGKPVAHFRPLLKNGQAAFVVTIAVDARKHVIWAGDNSEGVIKMSYQFSGNNIRFQVLDYIDTSIGLTDGFIRSMLLDSKGTVWLGTRFSGVVRIIENNNHLQVQKLSAEAGMQCTRVTDIKEVGNKAIWFSTCNGIYQYQHKSQKWQAYTTADGLQQAEIFSSYTASDEQQCWAVSETGVTVIRLSGKKEIPPPLVNITHIMVLGKEDSSSLFKHQATTYKPDENSIGFQYAAASYTDEKKLWYKYKLEGYDDKWSIPTQSNSVNYASLPSGTFHFKVLASIDNVQWSTTPADFAFTIQKPFYKSTWFFVLVIASLMAAFYFFHTYRLRQKLKLERMRTRISADLHDDIGSTLSSISIISEGAMHENDVSTSRLMIKEISENTQMLMDKMDDIIWCVNPQNDSFQNLMLRIQKFSSLLFEAKGIDYNISIDKRINDIVLSMNQRQHLYLILKEAVNNLVKYSGAKLATININYEAGYLNIEVTDNGKGFDAARQQQGNGLRNMSRRAELLHGTLNIESNDHGTSIRLRSKIK